MANGRPGDSRTQDILRHDGEVFGTAIDSLVRELDAHLPPEERSALHAVIEGWPAAEDGTPRDPEALMQKLLAMRGTLGPRPVPVLPPARPAPLPPRRPGSLLAMLLGLVIGGFAALPLGLLAALLLHRAGLLPPELGPPDRAIAAAILAVAVVGALLGAVQGGLPTRLGHALLIALLGVFLGSLICGLLGTVASLILAPGAPLLSLQGGWLLTEEGRYVAYGALAGGALLALWTGGRAWRDWRG